MAVQNAQGLDAKNKNEKNQKARRAVKARLCRCKNKERNSVRITFLLNQAGKRGIRLRRRFFALPLTS